MDDPAADDPAGPSSRTRRPVVVDIDPWTFVALGAAAVAALGLLAVARSAPVMLTRVAVGVVVGLALSPLAAALQRRWQVSRTTAAGLVGGGLAILFALVVLLVAPPAVRQAEQFSTEVPATVEELYGWPIVGERLESGDAAGTVERWIDDLPERLDGDTLASVADRLLGGVVTAGIVLLVALGVLLDGDSTVRRVRTVLPERVRPRADRVGHVVYDTFGSYFAGSLMVASLNGVVILAAGLVLGVPLAPIAGLWSVFTNLVPQIGGFLGGSFFVLLALTESPLKAAIAAAIFLGYQQLENNVISPAIVGDAVNLSPPATMLAALVGGAAAGVPGALVATPLLGAAKAVVLERQGRVHERKRSRLASRIKVVRRGS